MNDPEDMGLNDQSHPKRNAGESRPRAVGSPLPVGAGDPTPLPQPKDGRNTASVPPGRALANSPAPGSAPDPSSNLQRAVSALRLALPFVQRLLPLLDGNIATTVSNILNPHPHPPPTHPPVYLVPLEDGLSELQTQHRDLRDQVIEQNSSLRRVEDQLEMVREATDRNTLEQQELIEDLKGVGNKVNMVAIVALGLLAVSIVLNVILLMHIQRVLP